jgi:hypothetical protein
MSICEQQLIYSSTVDDTYPLYAMAVYDDAKDCLPLMVLLGSYMGDSEQLLPELRHMAEVGLFALAPCMRGRNKSAGRRDSGGVEIMDIHDAIQIALVSYKSRIDANNINIWGRSGGGGNVYLCVTRFPDLFRCAVALYGISDYGYDRHLGWYYTSASPQHRAQLERDIGHPDQVPELYMARCSFLGAANNAQTATHLFCDAEEEICPLYFHSEYLARAVAHGCQNIQLHLSGPGDAVRWTHDRRGYTLADAEARYLPAILDGTTPQPEMPSEGSLTVLGFLKSRRFNIWLGDGQNAVANVKYSLAADRKHFVFSLMTPDSRVRGQLAIPGPRPGTVLANQQETYWCYQESETLIEINPNRAYTWFAEAA